MRYIFTLILVTSSGVHAADDNVARQAGHAVGQFGAGVGEAVGEGVAAGLSSMQPQWITIPPRTKEECFDETGGMINASFMRCRNGRQEYVRYSRGQKIVLRERPIPE